MYWDLFYGPKYGLPWFMFHVYLKKCVVNRCWVKCSIKVNRSSSLIETFKCSFSVYYSIKIKSYLFLKLSQKDHTFEDCTDLSSNHGSTTHCLCALTLVTSPLWASVSSSVKWAWLLWDCVRKYQRATNVSCGVSRDKNCFPQIFLLFGNLAGSWKSLSVFNLFCPPLFKIAIYLAM